MKRFVFLLFASVTLLLITSPLLAAQPAPVGERINVLFHNPEEYPADTPFHILHGWLFNVVDAQPGHFDFMLEVDGVVQKNDWFSVTMDEPQNQIRLWGFNFPEGMTGTHTFTGHWIAPCQYAVDTLIYPGPCPHKNAEVVVLTESLTVVFTP